MPRIDIQASSEASKDAHACFTYLKLVFLLLLFLWCDQNCSFVNRVAESNENWVE